MIRLNKKTSEKSSKKIVVSLVGNPNTGKTSLFNNLSGSNLHVGNWSGVTVEKKESTITFDGKIINIVDLPGTYSINPYSEEEKVAYNFIKSGQADVIIQIVDVNALKRNLLMTFELLMLKKKVILAFNFNKEAQDKGIVVDVDKIKKSLQIPIVAIEANKVINKNELLKEIVSIAENSWSFPQYLEKKTSNSLKPDRQKFMQLIQEKVVPFYSTDGQNGNTRRIDEVILNRYTAFPIFLVVMAVLFQATFILSVPFENMIESFFGFLSILVQKSNFPSIVISLLGDGIINGVGSVLVFIPIIYILFFLISLIEDTGYLSRTVILVDRFFQKFGISGQSFIPMILGFGCNVPAIMATRSIKNSKERLIATLINPFISCSARLPVYVLFTSIFFPNNAGIVIMILYGFGIVTAFVASFLLSKIIKQDTDSALIIELPPYRMPNLKNALRHAWFQTSQFIKKAGTIIFLAVIIIWVLASLPFGVTYGSEHSLLGEIGQMISPVFAPLGFQHWSLSIALIFGVVAKEIVIGTLGTIHGGIGVEGLSSILPQYLSEAGALSFLFFVLLYIPCIPSLAVIKNETGNRKFVAIQILTTLTIAWIVSFIVYNIALLIGL